MKGVFFSTDFVKDKEGTYKFLELNTDTATGNYENFLNNVDLSEFFSFLQTNQIDTIEFIFKEEIHRIIVNAIKEKINELAPFITNVVEHIESIDSIYPTQVSDSDDKFILRLAYDETAILDSIYAKNNLNPILLFNENGVGDYGVPTYYSSSEDFINTIQTSQNEINIPDFISKKVTDVNSNVEFYKLKGELISGSYQHSEINLENRINDFISNYSNSDQYVSNFLINQDTVDDGVAQSLRIYSIMTLINGEPNTFHVYTNIAQSIFPLPTSLDTDFTNHYQLPSKHHYQLSTSSDKVNKGNEHGIFETERFVSSSNESLDISSIKNGMVLKSFHIESLPDTDDSSVYMKWSISGSTLPSGSFPTSSTIVGINKHELKDNQLIEVKLEGSDQYSYYDTKLGVLVYESSSNETKFIRAGKISKDNHFVYSENGDLMKFDESNHIILHSPTGSVFSVDVEPSDLAVVEGQGVGTIGFVIHNTPKPDCFIAGTQITLEDSTQCNIEDVKVGDKVLTYNEYTSQIEPNEVLDINSQIHTGLDDDYTVIIKFDNNMSNHNTNSHPYYVKDKGLCSCRPDVTLDKYDISVNKLEEGDVVFSIDDDKNLHEVTVISIESYNKSIKTYNLFSVENNHNFFANGILVHNKTKQ